MATARAVWGIEIGQCALKALKLRPADDGKVELVAFDVIEHAKLLSQPDADPDELIKAALEKFVSRNEIKGDQFVIGVPGQQTFSRFCKLPPVEEKKIPDIVKFEASQQIPFDMADVVWDYEVFRSKDAPDIEVGIFAMRNDLVQKQIDFLQAVGIAPMAIQTIPAALYNFCRFERPSTGAGKAATVIIDVGAQKTDLVVVEPNSAWSRNIPLGGNNFTDALVKAFKLSFAKAEALKRSAAESKYARQVFQAMRPVFADLVAEIQRSLGFYSSTHRDVELQQVLACGNAFRLPGLKKYVENNLTIPGGVEELAKFERMLTSSTVNAPQFTENILSFGPAFGLAIQGLGESVISSNLLPPRLARMALWRRKQPYFLLAAAVFGGVSVLPWVRSGIDAGALAAYASEGDRARTIVLQAANYKKEYDQAATDTGGKQAQIERLLEIQEKQKGLVPSIFAALHEMIPGMPPEFERAGSPEAIRKLIESNPAKYRRTARKQVIVEAIKIKPSANIDNEERVTLASSFSAGDAYAGGGGRFGGEGVAGDSFGGGRFGRGGMPMPEASGDSGSAGAGEPGFYVHISGRMLYGENPTEAITFLTKELFPNVLKIGRRPGQGWYIPDTDPKSPDQQGKSNLYVSRVIKVAPETAGAAASPLQQFGGRSTGRFVGGDDVVAGGFDPTAGAVPDPLQDRNKDPLTGEDMTSDWKFDLQFKIKLGEPPAPAADPNAAAGGGT